MWVGGGSQVEAMAPSHVQQPPSVCVWITGAPGTGKTTFIKEHILKAVDSIVDIHQWPLHKVGTSTQLVWRFLCKSRKMSRDRTVDLENGL
jgi:adenylate kinase